MSTSIKHLTLEQTTNLQQTVLMRESSGNYRHPGNQFGFIGGYQFGALALEDLGLVKKGVGAQGNSALNNPNNWTIPGGKEAFLQNKALQDQSFIRYANINVSRLEDKGVIRPGTPPGAVGGYVAASHLVGSGGAESLAQGIIKADANKTTSSSYFSMGKSAVDGSPMLAGREAARQFPGGGSGPGDLVGVTSEQQRQGEQNLGAESNENARRQTAEFYAQFKSNPLHDLASYAYGVSLHILSQEQYNNLAVSEGYKPTKNVLIASAGRFGDHRNEYFADTNFFIENLELESVIGAGSFTNNSNVTTINFTVAEPFGLSFLSRLTYAAHEYGVSYVGARYLIQIDFFGYDDEGIPSPTSIPLLRKFIPIVITSVDISTSHRGTEYKVSAVAASDAGLNQTLGTVPVNLGVSAATVKDFFGITGNILDRTAVDRAVQDNQRETKETNVPDGRKTADGDTKATPKPRYVVTSFTNAINDWNRRVAQASNMIPNEIEFVFDPEIESSAIVVPKELRADSIVFDPLSGTLKQPDATATLYPVNAGTSILAIISQVLNHSEYARSIINEAATNDKKVLAELLKNNQPIKWYRVTTSTELIGVNGVTYATKTIYHISKYQQWNKKYPYAPQGIPDKKYTVRDYQFYFTGKNKDILSWDIQLNTSYYINLTPNPSRIESESIKNKPTDLSVDDSSADEGLREAEKVNVLSVNPVVFKRTDGTGLTSPNKDSIQIKVDDMTRTMLTSMHNADMLSVEARILGDPSFIKQDSLYYPVTKYLELDPNFPFDKETGGILTDLGQIFVSLTFNSLTDYDESTGVMRLDPRPNAFSGIYAVIQVTSQFSRGRFEQTLKLIRMPGQVNFESTREQDQTTEAPSGGRNDSGATHWKFLQDEISLDFGIKATSASVINTNVNDMVAKAASGSSNDNFVDVGGLSLANITGNMPTALPIRQIPLGPVDTMQQPKVDTDQVGNIRRDVETSRDLPPVMNT